MASSIDLISLEFFGKGSVVVNSLEEFMTSDAYAYLKLVYGDLIFTQEKCLNFISIRKYEEKFIISENIFSEQVLNGVYFGSILPKSIIDIKISSDENIEKTNQSLLLSNKGYFDIEYKDDYAKNIIRNAIEKLNFVRFSDKVGYESPDKYIEYVKDNEDNITLNELENINSHIFKSLKELMGFNPLIQFGCESETRIQRMTKGDSLVRHFGSSKNEPYLATILTYYSSGDFLGRELYGGERSFSDLSRYLGNFIYNSKFDPYLDLPKQYIDTYEIKPSNTKVACVSAFNPRFYHAVKPHLGGEEVYVIITDLRLKK